MSQLDDAIVRYNKLLESGPFRDPAWMEALQKRMEAERLSSGGRLICPFLRPIFITRRQYESIVKTGEALISAIERMQSMVLANPGAAGAHRTAAGGEDAGGDRSRIPDSGSRRAAGFPLFNGTLQVVQYNADSPSGAA